MKTIASILAFTLSFLFCYDQIQINTSESKLFITGTSNVHDWKIEIKEFSVSGEISEKRISNLNVKINAFSFRSGQSIMDDKTVVAIKAKEYPSIFFKSSKLKFEEGNYSGSGIIEMIGRQKEVKFIVSQADTNKSKIKLFGEVDLLMSDFGIQPPTAMFGRLETNDQITVHFDILINEPEYHKSK